MFTSKDAKKPLHQRSKSTPFSQPFGYDGRGQHNLTTPLTTLSPSSTTTYHPPPSSNRPRSHQRALTSLSTPQIIAPRPTREPNIASPKPQAFPSSVFSQSPRIDFSYSPSATPAPTSPSKDRWSFLPGLGGEKTEDRDIDNKSFNLSDWFQGESAPLSVGVVHSPTKESSNPMESIPEPSSGMNSRPISKSLEPTPNKLQKKAPTSVFQSVDTSVKSSMNFFSRLTTKVPQQSSLVPSSKYNDLLSMNCKSALLGSSLADQFCPTAYKDLFQVADSLLSRMQAALREQALIIQELTAEKETAAEERIGFDMQVRHQKLQIKDMARNKEEQDTVIEDLVTQVAEIKQLRREEAEQRARTLRLVESNDSRRRRPRKQRTSLNSVDSTPSMTSAFDSDPREDEEDEEDGYDTPGTSVPPSPRMSWTGPLHVQHNDNLCRICRGPSGTHEWNQIQDENQALRGRVKTMEGELEGCLDMLQVFQIR